MVANLHHRLGGFRKIKIYEKRKRITTQSKLPAESPQPSKTSHFRMPIVQGCIEAFNGNLSGHLVKVSFCHSVTFSWSTAVSVCQMLQFLLKVNMQEITQWSSLLTTVD